MKEPSSPHPRSTTQLCKAEEIPWPGSLTPRVVPVQFPHLPLSPFLGWGTGEQGAGTLMGPKPNLPRTSRSQLDTLELLRTVRVE